MKVLQVVPRIAAQSSGPSYSVTRLSETLSQLGCNVELNICEPLPQKRLNSSVNVYPALKLPGAHRLGWSPAMRKGLMKAATSADAIHNHSMWMMPNIYCYEAARRGGCKLIFSPRGTLSEWSLNRSRWRKKLVWLAGQRAALFGADCLHATSEKELEEIRDFGLKQPVAVIPNGVDLPELRPNNIRSDQRTMLFLSRIHPAKNVDILLRAWKSVEESFADWQLVIAGPLHGDYPQKMQRLADSLGTKRVSFIGEVGGKRKSEVLAGADLFVLPTNSENFGLVVAEALAHGTPVVVTKGAPWAEVETHVCGWWIDFGKEPLKATLEVAMKMSETELSSMGEAGRGWMKTQYSWILIAQRMYRTYEWLLSDAEMPDWITL